MLFCCNCFVTASIIVLDKIAFFQIRLKYLCIFFISDFVTFSRHILFVDVQEFRMNFDVFRRISYSNIVQRFYKNKDWLFWCIQKWNCIELATQNQIGNIFTTLKSNESRIFINPISIIWIFCNPSVSVHIRF